MIDYKKFTLTATSESLQVTRQVTFDLDVTLESGNHFSGFKYDPANPRIDGTVTLSNDNRNRIVNVDVALTVPGASTSNPVDVTILAVVTQKP